ncbi:hypothetical protein P154DRAFT_537781 [Amniculicola lignicola CBS 123094]|uniref:Uncharacterized protein n=1 Tax=Amniculicola lignicola CBS 123094 TaxID=1392246 RepID=A0A6A5W7H5_9PLEO|nr:hypothetical protein P154DRAFT_537781 [Amniculicola lignicola CBS 123094]
MSFNPDHNSNQSPASPNHRLKRKRTSAHASHPTSPTTESYDDCDRPLPGHRKGSFGLREFFSKRSKNGFEKMPQQQPNEPQDYDNMPGQVSGIFYDNCQPKHSEPRLRQEGPLLRRRSTFGNLMNKVKKIVPRRKDSGNSEADKENTIDGCEVVDTRDFTFRPPVNAHDEERQLSRPLGLSASVEQLAEKGMLCFQERSTDQVDQEEGPSEFWRSEAYGNRSCRRRMDPFSVHDEERGCPETPTPLTNAEAGVTDDPHRWRSLNGYSPVPRRDTAAPRVRFSNVVRPLTSPLTRPEIRPLIRRGGLRGGPPPALQNQKREPSITPSLFTISNPAPFSPVPDLSFSFDKIGVLPDVEDVSISNDSPVPQATYHPSSNSSTSPIPMHRLSMAESSTNASFRYTHPHARFHQDSSHNPSMLPPQPSSNCSHCSSTCPSSPPQAPSFETHSSSSFLQLPSPITTSPIPSLSFPLCPEEPQQQAPATSLPPTHIPSAPPHRSFNYPPYRTPHAYHPSRPPVSAFGTHPHVQSHYTSLLAPHPLTRPSTVASSIHPMTSMSPGSQRTGGSVQTARTAVDEEGEGPDGSLGLKRVSHLSGEGGGERRESWEMDCDVDGEAAEERQERGRPRKRWDEI